MSPQGKAKATSVHPKSPSLVNHPACDVQVQSVAAELWGKKLIIPASASLVTSRNLDGQLAREIYFLSNRTDKPVEDVCAFRDGTLNAKLCDTEMLWGEFVGTHTSVPNS